ncbi:hypothetical protein JH06_1030 [Blastocystis sp. subtype 4]|uniref:hypothetical protein n=1 Tax=Blastocystis sp. subtype 4 TaxID=944170 RepID=UPI00071178FC|nr:hypothetical protein JH06_1030 [Blastocystis sp. subtype 4]KNB45321.1 hypothetical protein JH06_1030 [Blastocystis sp. subtype 4]|eukprot:XP_014528764.1 hypothetical protein JH06_1030 [Blastocystis sp. subtype 4]
MATIEEIRSKSEEYVQWDPVDSTREEIATLIKEERWEDLRIRIMNRLVFGTAGLRGRMGAGYSCMNDLVVLQTAQGLSEYLLDTFGEEAKSRGVVVGYDHRAYGDLSSKSFFDITVKVFSQKGIKVYAFHQFAFTPLPFVISEYHCCAGIMITASHNPAADNGYKIYWENACQIIPPHDIGISNAITKNLKPWCSYATLPVPEVVDVTDEAIQKYMSHTVKVLHKNSDEMNNKCPRIMYTAMHGVGYRYVKELLHHFHLPEVAIVNEQINPDPSFPTVSFPNPEEKGALDLAMKMADKEGIEYVMATDPDADRFICCQKTSNGWHVFKGDEIGAIFGYYMCSHSEGEKRCLINSVVSSRLLLKIGEHFGVRCDQTLTGFKWMGNRQAELEENGYVPMVTYEEAIGYAVGGVLRDKDGVSATAKMCEIISDLVASGSGLVEYLAEIYSVCGYFTTRNGYVISHDKLYTDEVFERLRNQGNYLFQMGSYPVKSIRDLTTGFDSVQEDQRAVLPVDPSSQMITFEFTNGACLTLRTSGTEPKIKYYLEVTHNEKIECEKLGDAMEMTMKRIVFDQ